MEENQVNNGVPKKGLAIASLSVSIVALFLSFCFGFGFILALPALALGIIAIVKKQGAMAIIGTSLSALALIVSILIGAFFVTGINSYNHKQMNRQMHMSDFKRELQQIEDTKSTKAEQSIDYEEDLKETIAEAKEIVNGINTTLPDSISKGIDNLLDLKEDLNEMIVPGAFTKQHQEVYNAIEEAITSLTLLSTNVIVNDQNLVDHDKAMADYKAAFNKIHALTTDTQAI